MKHYKTLILCGLYFVVTCGAKRTGDTSTELLRHLLRNYDRLTMPPGGGVPVGLGLALNRLSLDVHEQTASANIVLREKWRDSRLAWDPDNFEGMDRIVVPPSRIFTPDILLLNGVTRMDVDGVDAVLLSDGSIVWSRPARVKVDCLFPHGSKACQATLEFGSWVRAIEMPLEFLHGVQDVDTYGFAGRDDVQLVSTSAYKYLNPPDLYLAFVLEVEDVKIV